jgi:hypothetical protein
MTVKISHKEICARLDPQIICDTAKNMRENSKIVCNTLQLKPCSGNFKPSFGTKVRYERFLQSS